MRQCGLERQVAAEGVAEQDGLIDARLLEERTIAVSDAATEYSPGSSGASLLPWPS